MEGANVDRKNSDKPEMANGSCGAVVQDRAMKKTSRLAIASLIAALLSIIFAVASLFLSSAFCLVTLRAFAYFSIAALLLGAVALIVIAFSHKKLKGHGYAIAAIALAVFYILVGWGLMARVMHGKIHTGKYNLRQLGRAISQYCQANDGYLPVAEQWCDLLLEYDRGLSGSNFKHPLLEGWECNFAFNKNLSGLRSVDVPGNAVLVFGADGDWNLTGTAELLKERPDFIDTYVLFADGAVYRYRFKDRGVLKWDDNSKKTFIEPLHWKP